ncbi:hypothetical protein PVA45_06490 [Entomospira entomophila]|nr:hypothetical protein [Entomospira entomophilus]WDI35354.1 hypothetical protein PVA45_06490 [Entomospira entomophilus]
MKMKLSQIAIWGLSLLSYGFASQVSVRDLSNGWTRGYFSNIQMSQSNGIGSILYIDAYNDLPGMELLLNFESLDEYNSAYSLVYGEVTQSSVRARTGRYSAAFSGDNVLVLEPHMSSIFAGSQEKQNFSIGFWVNPLRLGDGEILFSYRSSIEHADQLIHQSISAFIEADRIVWRFENVFFLENGDPILIELMGEPILRGEWVHQLVSMDVSRGFIQLLQNNEIVATRYTSIDNYAGSIISQPKFQGRKGQELRIGEFYGYLDGFLISRDFIDRTSLSRYESRGHFITEPIPVHGMILEQISVIAEQQDSAEIRMLARASQSAMVLQNMSNESGWVEVNADFFQKIERDQVRFIQLRADFFAGRSRLSSPTLRDIHVEYIKRPLPAVPGNLRYDRELNQLRILWQPLMTANVAGYRLYFGTASGEYFGSLEQGLSPIDIGMDHMISLSGLVQGRMYYFSLVSYDEHGVESQFSPELAILF